MSTAPQPAAERHKTHFVPNQFCVSVSSTASLGPDNAAALFSAVNEALKSTPTPPTEEVAALLKDEWGSGAIQPLERQGQQKIVFFSQKAGGTTAHLYYERAAPPEAADAQNDAVIIALALHLNQNLPFFNNQFKRNPPPPGIPANLQITAVTPHWLGVAVNGPSADDGGPAAPPKAIRRRSGPGNWQFRFSNDQRSAGERGERLQDFVEAERAAAVRGEPSNVVVIVLDTCPDQADVDNAVARFTDNKLLQLVGGKKGPNGAPLAGAGNGITIHTAPLQPPADLSHLTKILPVWVGELDDWYNVNTTTVAGLNQLTELRGSYYAMPDHGLFVAGIVKDIAPTAELHLVRVMDDAGVTDLLTFTDTISTYVGEKLLNSKPDANFIVNLSLSFSVPSFADFKATLDALFPGGVNEPDPQEMYALMHHSLKDVMDWLAAYNVLIIAAVGNDYNETLRDRPEPRFPAYYDNVLSVAAISQELRPAHFSNRGARNPSAQNGIATLGGDTNWNNGAPRIEWERRERPDAVRGIFSGVDLPFQANYRSGATIGKGGNKTGWVEWVGTSFATPIIAGIAAVLWKRQGGNARDMIGTVREYAAPAITTQNELNCGAIFAEQVLVR